MDAAPSMQPAPDTVAEALDAWLAACAAQGLRASSLRAYRVRVRVIRESLGGQALGDLAVEQLVQLAATRSALSGSTRHAELVAWQQWLDWLAGHRGAPVRRLEVKRPPIGERERLPTADETKGLLAAAGPEFHRIYRALRLTGARPGELVGATLADWDRARQLIVLRHHKTSGETGRSRRIAVTPRLAAILEESLAGATEPTTPLFRSPSGRAWTVPHLSRVYRQTRDRAGLPRDLCLYLTRAEHATQLVAKKDLATAAAALGHRSVNTTRRYARTTDEQLHAIQDLFEE